MAEKPIILSETVRYFNASWDSMCWGSGDPFNGDDVWGDNCIDGIFTCNYQWYHDYLDAGKPRHIESYVFYMGDGCAPCAHLVEGRSADTRTDPPHPLNHAVYGWHCFEPPDEDYLYRLGSGGEAIKAYAP